MSGKVFAVYEDKNKGWRNAGFGPAINPGSCGFWLNEEAVATGFPPDFNNTLIFIMTTVNKFYYSF